MSKFEGFNRKTHFINENGVCIMLTSTHSTQQYLLITISSFKGKPFNFKYKENTLEMCVFVLFCGCTQVV